MSHNAAFTHLMARLADVNGNALAELRAKQGQPDKTVGILMIAAVDGEPMNFVSNLDQDTAVFMLRLAIRELSDGSVSYSAQTDSNVVPFPR